MMNNIVAIGKVISQNEISVLVKKARKTCLNRPGG